MLSDQLQAALESRQQRSTRRRLVVTDGIDFSSNDFLGLASNTAYRADFLTELTRLGRLGSTGSRLLDGNSREAEELEARMARFHHAETALLFNSGFDANSGFFACVPQSGDTILYDEYIHASVHDGMKVCRAKTRKAFRHNDVQHLRELLMEVHPGNVFIAVETVYSMDGDMAPLEDIVRLKREVWPNGENGYIAVDEAHATGVYGDHGRGVVCALGLEDEIFARLHTFGKALGSTGAVLLGSALLREYLINYARPLIYSTFMPYYTLASIKVAYSWLEFGKTKQYQEHVHHLTAYFRNSVVLSEAKLLPSSSPIQGIIVEGSANVRKLSAHLNHKGFQVKPICHPTVPKGKERVRICLHGNNTYEQVSSLAEAIKDFFAAHDTFSATIPTLQAKL